MPSAKRKLKQQGDVTTYLLIRLANPTALTTPNAGKAVEQQEASFIAVGGTVEDSLAASHNSKHLLTTGFSNCTPC